MNIFSIIILTTLLLEYALNFIAKTLNLKTLNQALPAEFNDVYDAAAYEKMQSYTRVNARFGFISAAFNLAVVLIFWFSGGFNEVDQGVRTFGLSPIWNGLIYIGTLLMGSSLLSLPFDIYDTFVIEARFGFNRTTVKTFILDRLKGLLLTVALGGPLLTGVLAFFQHAGSAAWLYCWMVSALYVLLITFIAPTWIMPLFNKFTPLTEGALRSAIMEYAGKVRFPLQGVFVMDGSKRSTKSNAFFTGFGKNKRIALFDTLIEKHTVAELTAILAHEIGHYRKKHVLIGTVMSIAHMGIMFYLLSIFISHQGLFAAFYMQDLSLYAGLLFFGMLFSPVELLLAPLLNVLSRRHEFQADRFAAETSGLGSAMIQALKKLSRDNLSHLTPHPFYVFLYYSHPPVLQRIARLGTVSRSAGRNSE